jgi:hypothetical protein
MADEDIKPLNWKPIPGIGYSVERRADGGMYYTFTNVSHQTLAHWREFALEHLLASDRLTRNLYDLSQVNEITEEAINYAVEVSSDPSTRNVRLAVVVANQGVRESIDKIASLTTPGWMEIRIFTDLQEAESWLNRPLTLMV